jgi:hypothetical protein
MEGSVSDVRRVSGLMEKFDDFEVEALAEE